MGALLAVGCATQGTTTIAEDEPQMQETTYAKDPAKKGAEVEVSESWAGYTPKMMDEARIVETAFPTGQKKTSSILVQQVVPLEVLRNAEYLYEYHVTNLTPMPQESVVLAAEDFANMSVVRSMPDAIDYKGRMQWDVGRLEAHETKVIKVYAKSESPQPASCCVFVTYESPACTQIKVVEPSLLLVKTATGDGIVCDDFVLHYEVTNPGTGKALKVKIKDQLPEGLRTHKDERVVEIAAGDLAPGEKKVFDVKAKAIRTGKHLSMAVATAEGGLKSESENVQTIVYQPVLAMTAEGADQEFVGRNLTYRFMVKNTGDANAADTVVVVDLPRSAQFVQASQDAVSSGGKVSWKLGTLAPGEWKSLEMRVKPEGIGNMPMTARATAKCAEPAAATTATSVVGVAAILLELVDRGDPAELGNEVVYTITATNQGTATDRDIRIVCEIPPQQELLSFDGPTTAAQMGQTLRFIPLATLAPGQRAQWEVRVIAKTAGGLRFKVSMTSEQFGTVPVEETEATTQYE